VESESEDEDDRARGEQLIILQPSIHFLTCQTFFILFHQTHTTVCVTNYLHYTEIWCWWMSIWRKNVGEI